MGILGFLVVKCLIPTVCVLVAAAGVILVTAPLPYDAATTALLYSAYTALATVGMFYVLCLLATVEVIVEGRIDARRIERARQLEARLERFPIDGKWPDRGWLVMLRAHNRGAYAKSAPWLALPCRGCRREQRSLRDKLAFDMTVEGDDVKDPLVAGIELCEGGRSSWEFTRVVIAVVEIEEEGLFRNIVTFL